MPAGMFSTSGRNCPLAVVLSLAALPAAAQSPTPSLFCGFWTEEADGTWSVSREVDAATGATASRDTYEWTTNSRPFGTGMASSWTLNYYWPQDATRQKVVPEAEVVVVMDFRFDAKEIGQEPKDPGHTWIHLYRSEDPNKQFSVYSTSLTGSMDWNRLRNGNLGGRAFLSLDTLLAYGTGLEKLVWHIRGAPNALGVTESYAKGVLPIATMRGKLAKIQKLRAELDRKAGKFRSECKLPIEVSE